MKHGHGKWTRSPQKSNGQGNFYEGSYKNDRKHGVGYFEWESGNSYAGHYKDDERQGYGVMRWTEGSEYFGFWESGIQCGLGIMTYPDQPSRAGFFNNNQLYKPLTDIREIDHYKEQLTQESAQLMKDYLRDKKLNSTFKPLLTSLNEEMFESETQPKMPESGGLSGN